MLSTEHATLQLNDLVDATWRREVEVDIRSKYKHYDTLNEDDKFKLYLDYVLHTDIVHVCNKQQQRKDQEALLQVESACDVSKPVRQRLGGSAKGTRRMLKLKLFDGKTSIYGIEHRPLQFEFPPLGAKLLLKTKVLQDGVLLLTPENCVYLGGVVLQLQRRQHIFQEVLASELHYGRRGPRLTLNEYEKEVESLVADKYRMLDDLSHQADVDYKTGNRPVGVKVSIDQETEICVDEHCQSRPTVQDTGNSPDKHDVLPSPVMFEDDNEIFIPETVEYAEVDVSESLVTLTPNEEDTQEDTNKQEGVLLVPEVQVAIEGKDICVPIKSPSEQHQPRDILDAGKRNFGEVSTLLAIKRRRQSQA